MKKQITVLGQPNSERMTDMERVAKTFRKADVQVVYAENTTKSEIPALLKKIQGVVVYIGLPRVDKKIRSLLRVKMIRHHRLLNDAITKNKKIKSKFAQQKIIERAGFLGIPSFCFTKWEELEKKLAHHNVLHYPFIIKKNISSQGKDVHKIEKFSDLKPYKKIIKNYVFQPFIENKGDFRIFVIGNKVHGVILRTGMEGEYRNNISRGGSANKFTDASLLKKIHPFAKKLVKLFGCDYAGVDLIYDTKEKKLRFMEMNFMPQWSGFAKATGVDVAKELINYAYKQST